MSPALAGGFFTTEPPGKPCVCVCVHMYIKSPKPEDEFFEFSSFQGTSLSSSCDVWGAVPGTKELEMKTTRPALVGFRDF